MLLTPQSLLQPHPLAAKFYNRTRMYFLKTSIDHRPIAVIFCSGTLLEKAVVDLQIQNL